MRSIEDLTDQIRTRSSKLQFQEAMRAYSAGAYRAATIILWTAVIQDLTDKLRVLADAGDRAAQVAILEVETAKSAKDVRGMQAFENGLLDRSVSEFELLTWREAEELRRLADDRNACAHPSFQGDTEDPYSMTAEQVRAYARLVVDAVLSQAPIVGKGLVDRFTADTRSDSWPDQSLVEFLRARYFDRARSGVMRNIVTVAVKAAIRPPDGDNQVAGRCVAAIKAAFEIDEQLVTGAISDVLVKWQDHLSDVDLIRTLGSVGSFKATWAALGAENITRSSELLTSAPIETLIDERAFASGAPAEARLAAIYAKAIERLTAEHLEVLTRKPYPRSQWVPGVLDEVRSVRSWRSGESAMRMALRVADSLSTADLEVIAAEFVRNDQIHRAADMPQLMQLMIEATASVPGARDVWQRALAAYMHSYQADADPDGYYNYSEAREYLNP